MFDTRLRRAPLTRATRWGLVAAFAALTLPIAAVAQTSFGSVSGVVTDPMSRVLPGVTITIVDAQKTATHEVRTDCDGRFQLVGLVPGTYTMQTELPGFQPQSSTFVVNGNAVEHNLSLEMGAFRKASP